MQTKFIEATNHNSEGVPFNHGKFMVARFDHEWGRGSHIPQDNYQGSLLTRVGWSRDHLFVMDLQTGEGAMFLPSGFAQYDLQDKHNIWACPLFLPFLTWLYKQDLSDLDELPDHVGFTLSEAHPSLSGFRGNNQPLHGSMSKMGKCQGCGASILLETYGGHEPLECNNCDSRVQQAISQAMDNDPREYGELHG